jgi:hypothetical protein
MSASFPTSIRTLRVPAANEGIRFDDVANISEEVTAMLTAFINGRARASAYHNTTQTLTTAVEAVLSLNSEDFDAGTMHDTRHQQTRASRFRRATPGIISSLAARSSRRMRPGYRQLNLYKNGTTILATTVIPVNSGTQVTVCQVSAVVSLTAADYLELAGSQNSGGNLAAGSATRSLASWLQVVRIW